MKALLFSILFCSFGYQSFGQTQIDTLAFYKSITKGKKLHISEKVLAWDSTDYAKLEEYGFVWDSYIKDNNKKSDSPLFVYPLQPITDSLLKINPLKKDSVLWSKTSLSKNIRILKEDNYLKIIPTKSFQVKRFQQNLYIGSYCRISKPIFSRDGNIAIIKISYLGLKMSLRHCKIRLLYFKKVNNTWVSFGEWSYHDCIFC